MTKNLNTEYIKSSTIIIKNINNFKMESIHFTKEDNRIGKGAHSYQSWEKCKFKPQKAKVQRTDNCHC